MAHRNRHIFYGACIKVILCTIATRFARLSCQYTIRPGYYLPEIAILRRSRYMGIRMPLHRLLYCIFLLKTPHIGTYVRSQGDVRMCVEINNYSLEKKPDATRPWSVVSRAMLVLRSSYVISTSGTAINTHIECSPSCVPSPIAS